MITAVHLGAIGVLLAVGAESAESPPGVAKQLVRNARFVEAGEGEMPADWQRWTPEFEAASCRVRRCAEGLAIDAPGRPFAVGGAWQRVQDVAPGTAYAVEADCTAEKLAAPYRSVFVRLTWLQGARQLHPAGMLVRGPAESDGRLVFRDVLVAPAGADGAEVSLEVRWPQDGSVCFSRVEMRPAAPPKPRRVRIGTVYLRPRNSTPDRNLDLFCGQIDEAGRQTLDIVCLPECLEVIGTGRSGVECAGPIPGPASEKLGAAARRNQVWVVAGLSERDGDRIYNTAVLLDRAGKLAGKYRKVHLPREEWKKGITPGHEYPVFDTDFGTIAIQICYDWFFPEPAAIFASRGAEILLAPTWGDTSPDAAGEARGETVFRTRARDNGLYLVPSVYDGHSLIIDPLGRILASNAGREGVFSTEVDLNQREALEWVGQWRAIGPRDRMPATYGPLLEDPPRPNY